MKLTKDQILELLRWHHVETDVGRRREQGIAHHPKSVELMSFLKVADLWLCRDYFVWKTDSREQLLYELDMWFELMDKMGWSTGVPA